MMNDSGDMIIKQDVLTEIDKWSKNEYLKVTDPLNYLHKRINSLLTVTLQPKVGQWINGDDKCPCCGKSKFEGLFADVWADWQPKYCPNCGAEMIEPQEEMPLINWQYCNDLNDINEAIKTKDENWDGLTSADDIISIAYDTNHGCYVVFWVMKGSKE